MPSTYVPTGQDWSDVNVGKSSSTAKIVVPKTERELAKAKEKGLVVAEKRLVLFMQQQYKTRCELTLLNE